jgi:hypothetical protein
VSLGCFALYCEDDAVRDHVVEKKLSFDSKGVFVGGSKKKKNKPKGKFGDMFRIKKEKYGCAAILCLCCDKCYIINM